MLWNKIGDNKDESDNQQSTGASTLSPSLSALLPGGGGLNTQEDGKDVTLADQFCESSSSGEKDVVSFSFSHHHTDEFVSFVRSQFPYYSTATAANYVDNTTRIGSITSSSATTARSTNAIFFESGGGAQVPKLVVDAVALSLGCRDRSVIGRNLEKEARLALSSLLVNKINYSTESFDGHMLQLPRIDDDDNFEDDGSHVVIMGSNATSLLDLLARRMYESGILYQGDEIVISSENHLANVTPWLDLAAKIVGGVTVKWWTVVGNPTATNETAKKNDHRTKDQNYCAAESSSCILSELITNRTRIVAISHVSNVLGMERDVPAICDLVHRITKGRGHVVVDGVAAAPHLLSSKAINATKIGGQGSPEWYIVSLHKCFGPHLGCLIGRRSAVEQMTTQAVNDTVCTEGKGVETDAAASSLSNEALAKSWERGTMNYEACSGSIALLKYAEKIGMKAYESFDTTCSSRQTSNQVTSESYYIKTSSLLYVNIASTCVQYVEDRLVCRLLGYLQSCTPLVRIIQDVGDMKVSKDPHGNGSINLRRVPTVCFFHASISSQAIVEHCRRHGVLCRACKFLSTDRLWDELLIGEDVNVVRFSLAHYNTPEEIDASFRILEMLEGWH
jgi:selenocysteine lyase/cysteine desulfurase